MAAIDLVGVGQSFLGENPQVVKVRKVTLGFNTGDVQTGANQGTYALFNIPAGAFVLDLWANVNTAWTALVTITIGDGTSPAGFFASADLAPQTAVSSGLFKKASASAEAMANGKYYAAADTIDAVVAGANPDAGELDVYIAYIENVSPIN
jgi:hypothetical protein